MADCQAGNVGSMKNDVPCAFSEGFKKSGIHSVAQISWDLR
jgi:hypothetical protein